MCQSPVLKGDTIPPIWNLQVWQLKSGGGGGSEMDLSSQQLQHTTYEKLVEASKSIYHDNLVLSLN